MFAGHSEYCWRGCLVQFLRDVEDEKMWINERLARAKSPNYGNSLLSVQMLLGKNRSLRNEVDSHEPTVISIVDLGLSMIEEGHPQSDEFQQHINELNTLWTDLQNAVDRQKACIELSGVAQQVLLLHFMYSEQTLQLSSKNDVMLVSLVL